MSAPSITLTTASLARDSIPFREPDLEPDLFELPPLERLEEPLFELFEDTLLPDELAFLADDLLDGALDEDDLLLPFEEPRFDDFDEEPPDRAPPDRDDFFEELPPERDDPVFDDDPLFELDERDDDDPLFEPDERDDDPLFDDPLFEAPLRLDDADLLDVEPPLRDEPLFDEPVFDDDPDFALFDEDDFDDEPDDLLPPVFFDDEVFVGIISSLSLK